MDFNSLTPPYFHVLMGSRGEFGRYAYLLNYHGDRQYAVRWVRGAKMRRVDDLFDEFSAAFQFPDYFGGNWPGFDECICDLEWLPAKGYIVMAFDAWNILGDNVLDRPAFVRIMASTCKYWATKHVKFPSKELEPIPFHVLFHCEESTAADAVLEFLRPVAPDVHVVPLKEIEGARMP